VRKLAQPWLHPSLLLVAKDFAPSPPSPSPSPLSNFTLLIWFIAIIYCHLHGEEILRLGNHLPPSLRLGGCLFRCLRCSPPAPVYAKRIRPFKQLVLDANEPMSHRYTRLAASFMLIESPYLSICDGPSWQSDLHLAGTHMRSWCATVPERIPNNRTVTCFQLRTPNTVDSLCTLEQSYPPRPEVPSPEKGASERAGV